MTVSVGAVVRVSVPAASKIGKCEIHRCKPIHSYCEGFRCARITLESALPSDLTGVTGMGVRVVGDEGNDNCRGGSDFTSCLPGPCW